LGGHADKDSREANLFAGRSGDKRGNWKKKARSTTNIKKGQSPREGQVSRSGPKHGS